MKKDAPLGGAARDSGPTQEYNVAVLTPFRIRSIERVNYGSKSAEFTIDTPIGSIEADLFTPPEREPFVQPRSVRDRFTGRWRRTVSLNREFAARVLAALDKSPEHPKAERTAHPAEPSTTLLDSEQRFEAELDQLRGADAL